MESHGNSPRKITNGQTFRSHPPMSACGPGGLLELITMVLQMDAMPVLGGAHRNRQSFVVVVVVVVLPCGKTLRKAGWNMGPPMFNRGKLIFQTSNGSIFKPAMLVFVFFCVLPKIVCFSFPNREWFLTKKSGAHFLLFLANIYSLGAPRSEKTNEKGLAKIRKTLKQIHFWCAVDLGFSIHVVSTRQFMLRCSISHLGWIPKTKQG